MTGPFGTTAGPWDIRRVDSFEYAINSGSSSNKYPEPHRCYRMAVCYGPEDEGSKGKDLAYANARAIAQVPAMLALVEAASSPYTASRDLVEMARAIARELEEE